MKDRESRVKTSSEKVWSILLFVFGIIFFTNGFDYLREADSWIEIFKAVVYFALGCGCLWARKDTAHD